MKTLHDYECDTYAKIEKKYGLRAPMKSLAEMATMAPWHIRVDQDTCVMLHAYRREYRAICYQLYMVYYAERDLTKAIERLSCMVNCHDDDFVCPKKWRDITRDLESILQRVSKGYKSDYSKQYRIKRRDSKAEEE